MNKQRIAKSLLTSIYCLLTGFFFLSCDNGELTTDAYSPDSKLKIELSFSDSIVYKVSYKGKEVIKPSRIGMVLSDRTLGENPKIKDIQKRSISNTITPPYGKFSSLDDNFNETTISFEEGYSLVLRAYNEGVAYRFVTGFDNEIIVENEIVNVNINNDPAVILAETDNYTAWELMYIDYAEVSAVPEGKKAITPILLSMPENIKVVVAESDVRDYPGMYLVRNANGFTGNFAQYPDSTALGSWGFVTVVQRTRDYIAKTEGTREFPWRTIIITDDDKELLTNELVYKLATPQILTDISWVKPGKAAWEWWHDAMLPDADIPSGMDNRNTALYKYYIDFASENNLEYMMVDAGWSNLFDLSQVNPKVDIQEIINYGKSKNVGVFLWCTAISLTDRDDEFLEMMHNWGAVGIKVDFFDRDDQLAINWYETVAQKAAKYKLMVNFHGCSKPTGLQRAYPNVINFEAVRGEECSKWDLTASPQHHVTFPFIRMLTGPIDYTPGGMRNRSPQMFRPIDPGMPYVQGSRCHELAMFVIFDQYFAMLSDSPDEYRKYPDILRFLSNVPTSFDNTIALDARVGEYIMMAKQKGSSWYIGAMTNHTARRLNIDFSFLPKGKKYIAHIYRDSSETNLYADRYIYETVPVDSDSMSDMSVNLSAGGGFVIWLSEIN